MCSSDLYQYDPTGEYLRTTLKGARLTAGRYEAQPVTRSADGGLTLSSAMLGLELRAKRGGELRFHDPVTGEDLLSHREEHVRARQERARADQESARADQERARAHREGTARRAAEARIAELESLIRKQRG